MRIAMIGTRGVPAQYGGFETAVEEIGSRLVTSGHEVVVYCRNQHQTVRQHRGMHLVNLPAIRSKALETLSHTALGILHAITRQRPDVVFLFNSANAPLAPLLRVFRIPVILHTDGLESQRSKWGPMAKRYYRVCERLAGLLADQLISDSQGIADYYARKFGYSSTVIAYGADTRPKSSEKILSDQGLRGLGYLLVVARLEPENNIHVIIDGYRRSGSTTPLVIVGDAPYAARYRSYLHELAAGSPTIKFLGSIYDQEELNGLYAGCGVYLHGHSVGGTNPSLLRAMGCAAAVIAHDNVFNREVLGSDGDYFADVGDLSVLLARATDAGAIRAVGMRNRVRAYSRYRWDDVADGYGELAKSLFR